MSEIEDFKYQITLQVTFCKEIQNDETKYLPPIYLHSKAQTAVNDFKRKGRNLENILRLKTSQTFIIKSLRYLFPKNHKTELKNNISICKGLWIWKKTCIFNLFTKWKTSKAKLIGLLLIMNKCSFYSVQSKYFIRFVCNETKRKEKKIFLCKLLTMF